MGAPRKTDKKLKDGEDSLNGEFDLQTFFPYLVRVFHVAVSQSLSEIYKTRLKISINEWRVMAVLGTKSQMTASEIVEHSSIDKVVVSRSVKGLAARGYLRQKVDMSDRRRTVLSLSKSGHTAFSSVLPLVQQREKEMLCGLSEKEKETLLNMMVRVKKNAEAAKQDR